MPGVQAVHKGELVFAVAKKPAVHAMQEAWPVSLWEVPPTQALHPPDMADSAYFPAMQAAHIAEPTEDA